AELSIDQKVGVIRQLTEAVGYAHRNHVVHRGLTPRAVTVEEKVGELRVRLGDWQVAGMEDPTAGSRPTGGAATRVLRLLGHGVAPDVAQQQAEAYVAPEGRFDPDADRVRLDVFALGAVAYYVVAGRPPASTPNELRDRVQRENGLDLAADVPEAPDALRRLVLHATRPKVSDRLADVAAFLEQLSTVDGELTVPGENAPADPLDAAPGTRLGERFELVRRMGSGSTAVGLLVTDRDAGGERRVLKVALDDAAARRLGHEAEVLRALRGAKSGRLVRLVDDDVLTVGERSALLLESAGEQTLADVLHERERLSLDLLDRWGTDLLEALVALDKAGIDHRDVKPANLGVREQRNDRAKHLVLFDFSLARTPAGSVDIGTPRYRDPFLGSGTRQQWDSAAERFAAAATLHEMATGRVPVFGDGRTDPAVITDEATVDPAWFDPSIASEMVAFFRQALCRDARSRQHTAAEMLSQWRGIFGTPTTTVPEDADALVDAATPDTPLAESGLSARALSAVEPFDVATVGDLIRVDPGRLSRLTGVADPTRKEVRGRAKTWRERFPDAARRSAGAGAAGDSGPLADPAATATALVDACGTPRATARRRAAEVLLGLAGDVDGFATHADFAPALDVATSAAVSLSFGKLQDAWASNDEARATLDGVTRLAFDVLAGLGGIAWSDVLVAELAGTSADGEPDQRRIRLVQGLVRAALDRADATERGGGDEAAMTRRRRRDGRVLLASAPMLLDITDPLVERVERLVTEATRVGDPIVPASRAAGALRPLWPSDEQAIDDVGLARLAARLSGPVGASRQGELHDRDLAPGIAVRSAVGGLASSQAIAPEDLQARVRARFPDLVALPN
ncbi:MAG: protein kinase domain-containing protein, partial [Nocardioidaceae bacterium]